MATTDLLTMRDAFLADVVARPQDDTPRLVYADWLEENDEPQPCGRCGGEGEVSEKNYHGAWDTWKCARCQGSGRVPGPDALRAEFVRVQCELAGLRLPAADEPCPACGSHFPNHWPGCRLVALRRRERELLATHADTWGRQAVGLEWWYYRGFHWEWSRGFLGRLTCTSADWWGSPGEPARGPALVRAAPLEAVELSDMRPGMHGGEPEHRWWFDGSRPGGTPGLGWHVPGPVYRLLRGRRMEPDAPCCWHDDDLPAAALQSAHDALSAAALAWARLPECDPCQGLGVIPGYQDALCRPCHGLGRQLP